MGKSAGAVKRTYCINRIGVKNMPLMKDVKEEAEIRRKRNLIRIITWVIVAIVLALVWYLTK